MVRLPETSRALYDFRTAEEQGMGMHMASHVVVGNQGTFIGETLFDPSRHPTSAINLLSPMGMMTGLPYAKEVIPQKHLEMNVIIHDDSADRAQPSWAATLPAYKQQLASSIHEAIVASKQVSDQANVYLVGNPRFPERYGSDVRHVTGTEKPQAAAEKVAELSGRAALTFLLGDFTSLPLDQVEGNFRRTVAVKANHPLEMRIPAKRGVIPLGGDREVDTYNRRQLKQVNAELLQEHQTIVSRLGKAGVLLAATVAFASAEGFTNQTTATLADEAAVTELDHPLAQAVQTIRRQ